MEQPLHYQFYADWTDLSSSDSLALLWLKYPMIGHAHYHDLTPH